jgi:hypothetical protein
MDRRRSALLALLLFVCFTALAIVVSGTRPHLAEGTAPEVLQGIGYLCGLVGGGLLLAPARGAAGDDRRAGAVVVGALAVLVVLDALTSDSGGADIGAGFVRLICLVAIAVVTARLAATTVSARRSRS